MINLPDSQPTPEQRLAESLNAIAEAMAHGDASALMALEAEHRRLLQELQGCEL